MSLKVLVVEDQPYSRPLLEAILARCGTTGLRIYTARDGDEGLEIALRENPQLIMVDRLRSGMSPERLSERLRQDSALLDSTIISVSPLPPGDPGHQPNMWADLEIVRPFDVESVLRLIEDLLHLEWTC
jgi:CheY-like chemotaxis protein